MKIAVEELIENVKDELLCYEDAEKAAERWVEEFRLWLKENKGKKKDIIAEKDGLSFKIKDEDEIFEIADSYMDALAEGSIKQYWEKF